MIEDLPDDIKKDYMVNFMSVKDINAWCSINKDYSQICKDEELWLRLILRDFGFYNKNGFLNKFRVIVDFNKPRYFYKIYKLFTKIKLLDSDAIYILIDITLKISIYTAVGIFMKFLGYKTIEELYEIRTILYDIKTPMDNQVLENIENIENISQLIYKYKYYVRQRQLILFVTKLKKNGKKLLNELDENLFNNHFNLYQDKIQIYNTIDQEFIDFFNSDTEISFWSLIKLVHDNYLVFNAPIIINEILKPAIKTNIYENYHTFRQLTLNIISHILNNNLSSETLIDHNSLTQAIDHISIFVIGKYIDELDIDSIPSFDQSVSKLSDILLEIFKALNIDISFDITLSTSSTITLLTIYGTQIDQNIIISLLNIQIPKKYNNFDRSVYYLTE